MYNNTTLWHIYRNIYSIDAGNRIKRNLLYLKLFYHNCSVQNTVLRKNPFWLWVISLGEYTIDFMGVNRKILKIFEQEAASQTIMYIEETLRWLQTEPAVYIRAPIWLTYRCSVREGFSRLRRLTALSTSGDGSSAMQGRPGMTSHLSINRGCILISQRFYTCDLVSPKLSAKTKVVGDLPNLLIRHLFSFNPIC